MDTPYRTPDPPSEPRPRGRVGAWPYYCVMLAFPIATFGWTVHHAPWHLALRLATNVAQVEVGIWSLVIARRARRHAQEAERHAEEARRLVR